MAVQKLNKEIANHNYSKRAYKTEGYKSFEDFYPYYLSEHCNTINRRLHLLATTNVVGILAYLILTQQPKFWWVTLVQGKVACRRAMKECRTFFFNIVFWREKGITINPYKVFCISWCVGYGLAWIGHFIFEKNKPATFKHPIYSVGKAPQQPSTYTQPPL